MGSISTDKKGQKRYFYCGKDGKECSIWLGDIAKEIAESFRCYADRVVSAKLLGVSVDTETSRWLGELSDKYYERLVQKELVSPRKKETTETLGECIPKLIDARSPSVSGQTIEIWQQSARSLYCHFGEDRRVDSITRIDAEKFRSWLVSNGKLKKKGGLAPTTVWKRLQHVIAFFEQMVKNKDITDNPFEDLTMSPVVDEDRNQYIEADTIFQVMDVLPDAEWRLIAALWRFGGLRGSSEPLLLRWQDVLWDQEKIIVHAKKTKRYEGKATRIIPIFPELAEPLRTAFELADEGAVYVVEKHAPAYLRKVDRSKLDKITANLGSVFARYVERAGLASWPKTVNNLRASMETDLLDGKYGTLSIQVIADWLGHSPKVMLKSYRRVRETHFKQVTQYKPDQNQPPNGLGKVDGTKPGGFSDHLVKTRASTDFGLTGISTGHTPARVIYKGNGAATPLSDIFLQSLETIALIGEKRQWKAPCGNLPFCPNGEDRI